MRGRLLTWSAGVVVMMTLAAPSASGYIHFPPPTLQKMCQMSRVIRVLKVKAHSKEKGVIIFEATETLKGERPEGKSFRHVIGKEAKKKKKPIFDWVADGKQAVMFTIECKDFACGFVFIDGFCYSVDLNRKEGFWLLIRVDPAMAATFHGTADKLREVTKDLLAGKDVKVPVDEAAKPLSNEERRKRAPALNEVMNKNREK